MKDSNTKTCGHCGCILTIGDYVFTGHSDEMCKAGTFDRIRTLERMLADRERDLAILKDMMGRHVCAPGGRS